MTAKFPCVSNSPDALFWMEESPAGAQRCLWNGVSAYDSGVGELHDERRFRPPDEDWNAPILPRKVRNSSEL